MACLARAGLDPHSSSKLLGAVKAWATNSGHQELDAKLAGQLDQALRHIGESLMWAGIVVPRPAHEPCSHRAVEIAGVVRYHACTGDDGASDLAELRKRIEHGIEAPERAEVMPEVMPEPPDERAQLLEACASAFKDGDLTTRDIDEAIAAELGVKLPRARQLRRDAGIIGQRGRPKKGIEQEKNTTGSTCPRTT
jgi:hypothetical protein